MSKQKVLNKIFPTVIQVMELIGTNNFVKYIYWHLQIKNQIMLHISLKRFLTIEIIISIIILIKF